MNIIALIVIIYAILLMTFVRRFFKGLNPATFFTFFWSLQIVVITIGWANYMYFCYTGLFYILVAVSFFDLGYLGISLVCEKEGNPEVEVDYNERWCNLVYLVVLSMAFVGIIYNMHVNGFSLSSLFSLDSFLEMSNENSVNRYTGGSSGRSMFSTIFDINGYTCPLLGGLVYHYYHNLNKRALSFMGLVPCMLDGMIQGAKMGMITGLMMWIIGYVLSSDLFSKQIKIKMKHLLYIVLGAFLFVMLLFSSMMFRYGELNENTFYLVSGKVTSYTIGHIPAFDQWFDSYHGNISYYTFGGRTFNGITNPLGILKREAGVFDEPVDISPYGDSTNVYSVFRFFVEDFGKIGSLLYLFIMGTICAVVYFNQGRKKSFHWNTMSLSMIYFFISWSFVASIFAYTTYIALSFYIYFILLLVFKVEDKSAIETHDEI